jgi:hypothetical protein
VTSYEQDRIVDLWGFPGEEYYYRVRAYNDKGSAYSNEVYIKVMTFLPTRNPRGLAGKAVTSEGRATVRLFWAISLTTKRNLLCSVPGRAVFLPRWRNSPANSYSFEDPDDWTEREIYLSRVMACNNGGEDCPTLRYVIIPPVCLHIPLLILSCPRVHLHAAYLDRQVRQ